MTESVTKEEFYEKQKRCFEETLSVVVAGAPCPHCGWSIFKTSVEYNLVAYSLCEGDEVVCGSCGEKARVVALDKRPRVVFGRTYEQMKNDP